MATLEMWIIYRFSRKDIVTKLQSKLATVCEALGLKSVIPFSLTLADGCEISAQVLLPQLGAPKGTIIVTSFRI